MNKQAVSVTLAADNLLWLQAQTLTRGSRSLSATLDEILSQARGSSPKRPLRSVVGTVGIDESDPELLGADEAVRGLFRSSLGRPRNESRGPAGRRTSRCWGPRPTRA